MKQSFPPLIDADSEILILGTLPGEDSLKLTQYYGHSRNQFWRLIGACIGVGECLHHADYSDKCATLLAHRIALWDTVQTATRQGSLDSNIRHRVDNDIPQLLTQYPNIHHIAFNGKQARRFFKKHEKNLPRTFILSDLPSSSPAYTLAFAHKYRAWQAVLMAKSLP